MRVGGREHAARAAAQRVPEPEVLVAPRRARAHRPRRATQRLARPVHGDDHR